MSPEEAAVSATVCWCIGRFQSRAWVVLVPDPKCPAHRKVNR